MVSQIKIKKLLIIVFILTIPTVFGLFDEEIFLMAVNLREGRNIDLNPNIITTQGTISLVDDPEILGDLTVNGDLFLLGDFSFLGDIVNVTIVNQNVTGLLTISGSLTTLGNATANYYFGDGSQLTNLPDSSLWNRSGTNTILRNQGDKVGIGTSSPKSKLDVGGMQGIGAPGNLGIKSDSGAYAIRIEENSGVEGWHIGVDVDGDLNFDDSNTGIRLTFQDETGNVGIGTNSPAKDLEVYSSSPILRLRDSGATAGATTSYVEFGGTDATAWNRTGWIGDGSSGNADLYFHAEEGDLHLGDSSSANVMNLQGGNVGIGTASPSTTLEITTDNTPGVGGQPAFIIKGNANKERFQLESYGATSTPTFQGLSGRGTYTNPTQTLTGDHIFNLAGRGINDINASTDNSAIIKIIAAEDYTTTSTGAHIVFETQLIGTTGYLNRKERLRITDDGNVGIGTTTPTTKLEVVGNITADNVFLPQYVFAHDNETLLVRGANLWTNISFSQEVIALKRGITHTHNDGTNDTFTINADGIYYLSSNLDVIDTSASATTIDVASRIIFANGTEVPGSVFEVDIIKQQVETELTHEMLARLKAGDKIIFQFIADDADVEISTHGTFGEHPESVSIIIEKRYNLPGQGGG